VEHGADFVATEQTTDLIAVSTEQTTDLIAVSTLPIHTQPTPS